MAEGRKRREGGADRLTEPWISLGVRKDALLNQGLDATEGRGGLRLRDREERRIGRTRTRGGREGSE
jgi:hypothetical protein